ncbi:MAG: hypothetical protein ACK416_06630, partial [Zestosphaera sp.]
TYLFTKSLLLEPLKSGWLWMWARPVYRIYKVYEVISFPCSTVNYIGDDVENVIGDVLTSGLTIVGDREWELPHSELMKMFFNGTEMKKLVIPDTSLADGDLDPGESVALEHIFKYFDKCPHDFEIGIPAGSIAALVMCGALGLPTGGSACLAAIAFASAFQLSLSAEGSSIYVTGGIDNYGDYPGISGDYNVPEIVYVAVSKYQYKVDPPWWCFWCSPCYFNVPAGIYFKLV